MGIEHVHGSGGVCCNHVDELIDRGSVVFEALLMLLLMIFEACGETIMRQRVTRSLMMLLVISTEIAEAVSILKFSTQSW